MHLLTRSLIALALVLPAAAQTKIDIKPGAKAGLKWTRTTEIMGQGKISTPMGTGGGTVVIKGAARFDARAVEAEENQEVKDGAVTKLHRLFKTRAFYLLHTDLKPGPEHSSPLEGKAFRIELTDAKDVQTPDDPTGKTADFAAETMADKMTAALTSGKEVKVGESWSSPDGTVKAWMEELLPGAKFEEAKMTCKLLGFAQNSGQKCARVEVDASLKGKADMMMTKDQELTLTFKGVIFFGVDAGRALGMEAKGEAKVPWDIFCLGSPPGTLVPIPLDMKTTTKTGEAKFAK